MSGAVIPLLLLRRAHAQLSSRRILEALWLDGLQDQSRLISELRKRAEDAEAKHADAQQVISEKICA